MKYHFSTYILLLMFPFFFWGGTLQDHRLMNEVWELGHVVFYFFFFLWAERLLRPYLWGLWLRLFTVLCTAICIGLLVECIQYVLPGRYFSLTDMLHNAVGIIIALLVVRIKGQIGVAERFLLSLCLVGLVVCVTFPFVRVALDEYAVAKKIPVLSDFESGAQIDRWKPNHSDLEIVTKSAGGRHENNCLEVRLTRARYSGVRLKYFPRNWSGYQFLWMRVFSERDGLQLHYRVHDALHERNPVYSKRYNDKTLVRRGWNAIQLSLEAIKSGPVDRELDLSKVEEVGLFVVQLEREVSIFIDDVRLE